MNSIWKELRDVEEICRKGDTRKKVREKQWKKKEDDTDEEDGTGFGGDLQHYGIQQHSEEAQYR